MTKKEAMAFAISVGKPIRHNSFSKGEFVRYNGKELVDEEGTILPQQEFLKSSTRMQSIYVGYTTEWCSVIMKTKNSIICTAFSK